MTDYRRFYIPGSTWFFTVNLAERRSNRLLVERIELLREAFRYVKARMPFAIDAIVVMPDHLHCIWTLPPNDADFSTRWRLIKSRFSRFIVPTLRVNAIKLSRPGVRDFLNLMAVTLRVVTRLRLLQRP